MTTSLNMGVLNQAAFLRTAREFPEELHQLSLEVNRSYIDIANAVNTRTISLFPVNRPVINGESWFIVANQRQQGLRQIYNVSNTTNIPHGINFETVERFTRCFGEFTDGTNWYGLISGSNVAIAGQISFFVSPTNIVFETGAGAPALTKGTVILEWISQK